MPVAAGCPRWATRPVTAGRPRRTTRAVAARITRIAACPVAAELAWVAAASHTMAIHAALTLITVTHASLAIPVRAGRAAAPAGINHTRNIAQEYTCKSNISAISWYWSRIFPARLYIFYR